MLPGHVEYAFGNAELARASTSPHFNRCHVCSNTHGPVSRVRFCMTVLYQSPSTFRRCKLQKKYEEIFFLYIRLLNYVTVTVPGGLLCGNYCG